MTTMPATMKKLCDFKDCGEGTVALGLCMAHYRQHKRNPNVPLKHTRKKSNEDVKYVMVKGKVTEDLKVQAELEARLSGISVSDVIELALHHYFTPEEDEA